MRIEDGAGSGRQADVILEGDGSKRLAVDAVTNSSQLNASIIGEAFVSYNEVTFTVGTKCDLAYLKNTSSRRLIITDFNIFVGSSNITTATLDQELGFVVLPSVAPSTPTLVGNLNQGSPKSTSTVTTAVEAFKGDGSTNALVGLAETALPIQNGTTRDAFDATTVLEPNNSIGFTWKPPTGNTSQKVNFLITYIFAD